MPTTSSTGVKPGKTTRRIKRIEERCQGIEEAVQFAKDMDLEDYLEMELLELDKEKNRKEVAEMNKEKTANVLTKLEFCENRPTVEDRVKKLEQRLEDLCLYFYDTEPDYPEYLELGGETNEIR